MPATKAKAKSTPKLKKPHQLLEEALFLFGPKGENWIKGDEKQTIEEGFYLRSLIKEADQDALDHDVIGYEVVQLLTTKSPAEAIKIITKKYVHRDEVDTFCAIGALHEINTANEQKAIEYLAAAIDPKRVAKYKNGGGSYDSYETIITSNNDKPTTKFRKVRGWFKKAIAFAKKAGD